MRLKKLTKETLEQSFGKKICCVECSIEYLQELIKKYSVEVELIIEERKAKHGKVELNGREIPVRSYCALDQMEFSEWLFVITGDYYRELYDSLRDSGYFTDLKEVYYFANQETEYEEEFREKYKSHILENIIVFRSGPHINSYIKGMDFTDNARALFEYMLEQGYHEKYELVWLVKNPKEFKRYSINKNVKFISMEWSVSPVYEEREEYYRVLCLAKVFFFTDAYGFVRNARADQIRVQLWHGCGYKTRLNFSPCETRYEYTTVTSILYAKIHQELFGLRTEQMLVTGCAKQDWLFAKPEVAYRKRLGLPKGKKYIYWLPTYRKAADVLSQKNGYEMNQETGLPIVDSEDKLMQVNRLLQEREIVLVIKPHPYQATESIAKVSFSNIILLDNAHLFAEDIQVNQLLSEADALISDYSSVAVDYLALDRPMAFVLEDVEEYEKKRGFIFENIREYLPGAEIDSYEVFCDFLKAVSEGKDIEIKKRTHLRKLLNGHCDNKNCKRIVDKLGL